ncbi:hypothetical protein ACOSP7_031177 [Xanthoceras sorbifolium]
MPPTFTIHVFKQEARRIDSEGKTKTRKQIAEIWKSLPVEEKLRYGRYGKYQQQQQEEEIIPCVPGGRSGSPEDEDIPTDLDNFHVDRTFTTRCTPSRLFRAVNNINFGNILLIPSERLGQGLCLRLVQNFNVVLCSLCIHGKTIILDSCTLADIIGVPNRGQSIPMDGKHPSVSEWASKFSVSSRGICINHLERRVLDMTSAGTEFKITFCLFLMGSLLAPGNSNFVSADFIAPLTNVAAIPSMDWSTWCFNVLCDGIDKFKKSGKSSKTPCVTGCLLFLQLIYLDSVQLDPPVVDKSTLLVEIQSVRDEVTALRTKVTELMSKCNNLMDAIFKGTMKGDKGKQHVDDIGTTSHYADPRSTDVSVDIGCLNQSSHPNILPPRAQLSVDTAENMQSGVFTVSSSDRTPAQANENPKVPSVCEVDENTTGHMCVTDARQSPNNERRTYRYGPFEISFGYETIFECSDLVIERKVYRSLQPRQFVCDEVIDVVAHLLRIYHQSNNSPTGPSIWFLPTYFAYLALTSKDLSTKSLKVIMGKFKETHMPNFKNCNSIFIPVNDVRRHWYMVLVKCETGIVEVWDSFPPRRGLDKRHTDQVRKLMTSLDIVLAGDIAAAFIQEFCFTALLVKLNKCAPRQANGYDCGLFVCMFMRRSYPQTADMNEPSLFPNQHMYIDVAPLPMVKHDTKIP